MNTEILMDEYVVFTTYQPYLRLKGFDLFKVGSFTPLYSLINSLEHSSKPGKYQDFI